MSPDDILTEIDNSETSEENKTETSEYLTVAKNTIKTMRESWEDTTIMEKEYEELRQKTIKSIENDKIITKIELSNIKEEFEDMLNMKYKEALNIVEKIFNEKNHDYYKSKEETINEINEYKDNYEIYDLQEEINELKSWIKKINEVNDILTSNNPDIKEYKLILEKYNIDYKSYIWSIELTANLLNKWLIKTNDIDKIFNNFKNDWLDMYDYSILLKNKNITFKLINWDIHELSESEYKLASTDIILLKVFDNFKNTIKDNIENSDNSDIKKLNILLDENNIEYKDNSSIIQIQKIVNLITEWNIQIDEVKNIFDYFKNKWEELEKREYVKLFENSQLTLKLIKWNFNNFNVNEEKLIKNNSIFTWKFPDFKDFMLNKTYWENNIESEIFNSSMLTRLYDKKLISKLKNFTKKIDTYIKNNDSNEMNKLINEMINFEFLKKYPLNQAVQLITILIFPKNKIYWVTINKNNLMLKWMDNIHELNQIKKENSKKLWLDRLSNDSFEVSTIPELIVKITDVYPEIINKQAEEYALIINNIKPFKDNTKEEESTNNNTQEKLEKKYWNKLSSILKKPWASIDKNWKLILTEEIKIWDNWLIKMWSDWKLNYINSLWYTFSFDQDLNKSWDKLFNITDKMDFLNKIWFWFFWEDFQKMITRIKTIHGSKIPWLTSINIDESNWDFLNDTELMVIWDIFHKLWFFENAGNWHYQERPLVINKTEFANKIENSSFYSMSMWYSDDMFDRAMKSKVY